MMEAKARLIAFDIETFRCTDADMVAKIEAAAVAAEPDKKHLSPETVARLKRAGTSVKPKLSLIQSITDAWHDPQIIEERKALVLSKTSLDKLKAAIIVVSVSVDGVMHSWRADDNNEMADQMVELASFLDEVTGPDSIWIGHNIKGFDMPIILNTWRKLRIDPPRFFPKFRGRSRWAGRVFDTMDRVPCDNGLNFVKLSAVCEAYGLPDAKSVEWKGEPMQGSRVAEAFEAGEFDILQTYCEADVIAELNLYMAITFDDTRDTFDRDPEIDDQIQHIMSQTHIDEVVRKSAAFDVAVNSGRIRLYG